MPWRLPSGGPTEAAPDSPGTPSPNSCLAPRAPSQGGLPITSRWVCPGPQLIHRRVGSSSKSPSTQVWPALAGPGAPRGGDHRAGGEEGETGEQRQGPGRGPTAVTPDLCQVGTCTKGQRARRQPRGHAAVGRPVRNTRGAAHHEWLVPGLHLSQGRAAPGWGRAGGCGAGRRDVLRALLATCLRSRPPPPACPTLVTSAGPRSPASP